MQTPYLKDPSSSFDESAESSNSTFEPAVPDEAVESRPSDPSNDERDSSSSPQNQAESPTLAVPCDDDDGGARPSTLLANKDDEDSSETVFANEVQHLSFLFANSGSWVIAGILFMFAGITILQFTLLPRIYTCPPGAACSRSYNPRGRILQAVQTIMVYWLRTGYLIASLGISKVIAYQGWLLMMKRVQTVRNLELNLAVVNSGRARKAALLIGQRRNHIWLGLMVLTQVAIFLAIPLAVTFAISNLQYTGRVRATFAYFKRFTYFSKNRADLDISSNAWLLGSNDSYPFDDTFGTFVVHDDRTKYAIDAQPGGPRISGTVSCSAANISSVIIPPNENHTRPLFNLTYRNEWVLIGSTPLSSVLLGRSRGRDSAYQLPQIAADNMTVSMSLLWMTNSTGKLINSTTTNDGRLHFTRCDHTIDMVSIADKPLDHIQPTLFDSRNSGDSLRDIFPPSIPWYCEGEHDDLCLKVVIGSLLLGLWRVKIEKTASAPGRLIPVVKTCMRGALSLAAISDRPDDTCIVDSKSWTQTLSITSKALMATSKKERSAEQDLWVHRESISLSGWWFQAIIAGFTLLLYGWCVAYLLSLNRRRMAIKELSLPEIIRVIAVSPEQVIQEYAKDERVVNNLIVGDYGRQLKPVYSLTKPEDRDSRVSPGTDVLTGRVTEAELYHTKLHQGPGPHIPRVRFIFRTTALPVFGGIFFMFAGIVILRFALLPLIYTCPNGAKCRHSFDPRAGAVLRIVQAVMLYWLQAGCLISSIGLMKVIAYLGWLGMLKRRNTVETLALTFATIHGSTVNAALLILKRFHRLLALFALLLIAISALVPLIVDASISNLKTTGRVRVTFVYPRHFSFPNRMLPEAPDFRGQLTVHVEQGYYQWLTGDNRTHPIDQFSRTLIVRGNRTELALGAQPSGPRVSGTVSCTGRNVSVIGPLSQSNATLAPIYNVTCNNYQTTISGSTPLLARVLARPALQSTDSNRSAVVLDVLWLSNIAGTIVNGTTSEDGSAHAAVCAHTVELLPIPDEHLDHIRPSTFVLPSNTGKGSDSGAVCSSGTQYDLCFALIVANYFYSLWGGFAWEALPKDLLLCLNMSCLRGALSSYSPYSTQNQTFCPIDTHTWTLNLAGLTEGLLRMSKLSGEATQELWVAQESISRSRWWLQAVIPGATFALYMVCLACAAFSNPSQDSLRELTLSEIISAIATDSHALKDHVASGKTVEFFNVGGSTACPGISLEEERRILLAPSS